MRESKKSERKFDDEIEMDEGKCEKLFDEEQQQQEHDDTRR